MAIIRGLLRPHKLAEPPCVHKETTEKLMQSMSDLHGAVADESEALLRMADARQRESRAIVGFRESMAEVLMRLGKQDNGYTLR